MKEIDLSSKNLKEFPMSVIIETELEKIDLSTNTGHYDIWIAPNEFIEIPTSISN